MSQAFEKDSGMMTPVQRQIVMDHEADGFQIVAIEQEVVRLTRGADARLVRQDGVVKRAQHVVVDTKVTVIRGCV